jgi:proteasome accessory factor B
VSKKTPRWLDLVAFLLGHRFPVTRAEIFRKVGGYDGEPESARRKFERDKDELRNLGIEIETVTLSQSAGESEQMGYRLRPKNAYLPYLELVDEPSDARPYPGLDRLPLSRAELEILDRATNALATLRDTPLSAAAASARRKLAYDLPLTEDAAASILTMPIAEGTRQALEVLQEAVVRQVAVSCRYFTMSRRTEAPRELEPWGLLFQWGRWYCVARARDRDDPRTFRVDRMRDVKLLAGANAHFNVPDDFDVRSFSGRSPWEFGTGTATRSVVRFAFPESTWVINSSLGDIISEDPDRSARIAFDVRDSDALLHWLLSFGRRAEIIEPEHFRDALTELRADIAALYAESSL